MKKISFFILLFTLCALSLTKTASAHVLQTDGTIGAVMHIDPNDDPIAGQQANLFFSFKDTTQILAPKNCDCKIAIVENGQTIYAQPLFQDNTNSSLENADLFYTFPQPDVYQVIVTGTPLSKNSFHSFKLVYNVRAEQPNRPQTATKPNFITGHFNYIFIGIILFAICVFVLVKNFLKHESVFPKPKK